MCDCLYDNTVFHLIMMIIKFIKKLRIVLYYIVKRANCLFPDKLYLKVVFLLRTGKNLNLSNPQTFNEKLQWLKLYYRRPILTSMVDKYEAKRIVANIIGEEYIIPTIGVWDKPEEIDFDELPEQFVLKTTHGGGNSGVVICRDKSKFNREEAINKLNKSLKQEIYSYLREWPYKNVPKRIIAETYMEDGRTHGLWDYKFFAFNGVVKSLFVATERDSGNVKFDFYDQDFNHLDLVQTHPMSGQILEKPKCFEEMKKVAEKLSEGLPEVRIDLYDVNGKVYFGEFTFFHHGGVEPFHPEKWDYIFGSWIDLPTKTV